MKKLSAILKIDAELDQILSCREVWNFRKMKISLFTDKNQVTAGSSILVTDIGDNKFWWLFIGPLYCCGSADIISVFY